jgi:hypothetical protein
VCIGILNARNKGAIELLVSKVGKSVNFSIFRNTDFFFDTRNTD